MGVAKEPGFAAKELPPGRKRPTVRAVAGKRAEGREDGIECGQDPALEASER